MVNNRSLVQIQSNPQGLVAQFGRALEKKLLATFVSSIFLKWVNACRITLLNHFQSWGFLLPSRLTAKTFLLILLPTLFLTGCTVSKIDDDPCNSHIKELLKSCQWASDGTAEKTCVEMAMPKILEKYCD